LGKRFRFKRRLQAHQLIKDYPKAPDVGFEAVGQVLNDFWREVVRRPDLRLDLFFGVSEQSGDSEVSKQYAFILFHEDVLALQVTVDDFFIVNVL